MKKYPCPSCGAEIPFRTSIASHGICPYCRTMVVRDDQALRKTGEMAQLPEDFSPFQIGSEGKFRGVRFGIVGRMRIGWEHGSWNEWFIVSDDGRKGWLAEAQGFYAPCFEVGEVNKATLDTLKDKLRPGMQIGIKLPINGALYRVVDVKEAECIGAQGELPFDSPVGRKTITVDLLKGNGDFASIELLGEGEYNVFEGAYVSWASLSCKYYRSFEGW